MRIAVLFPSFLGGGAEAVCAWMLESLKEKHEVTLVALSQISLASLDEQYGTSLKGSGVGVLTVPVPFPNPIKRLLLKSLSAFIARQFYLMWFYRRRLSKSFDLAISAFNEMDLGKPGIQYIHLPIFGQGHERLRSIVGHPHSTLRTFYREMVRRLSGYSESRMRKNITLANSEWTARWIKELYGIEAKIVYPPAVLRVPAKSWDKRENGFVLVARTVREKRIEVALRILSEVRSRGFDVHLHILGGVGDPRYLEDLKATSGIGDWVTWERRLKREEYERMLAQHKYGFHPRVNEQFGIGIAEMVLAGVIPFVPSEGGQAEIVDYNEHLVWREEAEAVAKIVRMLEDENFQRNIRAQLLKNRDKWLPERFRDEILEVVSEYAEGKGLL